MADDFWLMVGLHTLEWQPWKYGIERKNLPLRQILVIVLNDFNGNNNVIGIILF